MKGSPRESCIVGMENSSATHMEVGAEGGGLWDRGHLENNELIDILMGLNMQKMPLRDFLESSGLFQKKKQFY